MKQKMGDKHKLMAYILSTDADLNRDKDITQKDISNLFGVSQPTVAQAIKETRLRLRINELETELSQLKGDVMQIDGIETLALPSDIDTQYRRKP